MSDIPRHVTINEEGPREGFQIEPGPIATADKIRFIEALAETGVHEVQCVSFVDPRRVPGMVDADEVARGIRRRDGVRYTGIWLNLRGLQRAITTPLDTIATLQVSASETFSIRNTNKNTAETIEEQRRIAEFCNANGVPVETAMVMTAFGCNYEGEVPTNRVIDCVAMLLDVADEAGIRLRRMRFADTVGWAAPNAVERVIGSVRDRWPDLGIGLHLHDTRGSGLANAYAGLRFGVDNFDTACAGLGGCPFAAHKGAAGNICTEDFVFLCQELGATTDIDLEAMVEAAHMAEAIVGHPLPGKIMRSGSLAALRLKAAGT